MAFLTFQDIYSIIPFLYWPCEKFHFLNHMLFTQKLIYCMFLQCNFMYDPKKKTLKQSNHKET